MASPGFSSDPAQESSIANAIAHRLRAEAVVKSGAGWFITIAVLSVVNSVLTMSNARFHFIFGLGVTQVVDAISTRLGTSGFLLDLVINGFVAGIFVVFWHFGRKGQSWAFWTGMGLYALDGVIVLLFKDYLAVAFHAYALYRIYMGFKGVAELREAEAMALPAGAPISPQ